MTKKPNIVNTNGNPTPQEVLPCGCPKTDEYSRCINQAHLAQEVCTCHCHDMPYDWAIHSACNVTQHRCNHCFFSEVTGYATTQPPCTVHQCRTCNAVLSTNQKQLSGGLSSEGNSPEKPDSWEKEFDKKFMYGDKWKTYGKDAPVLIEPRKVKDFIRNLLSEKGKK